MSALHFIASVAIYFVLLGALLAFFKGATRRNTHDQLRDDIDQIEAVSRPGDLS